jgi:hypothetical protein
MKRRLGGPPQAVWAVRKQKNLLFLLRIEPRSLSHPAPNITTIPSELFELAT